MSINKVVLLSAFLMTFSSACSSDLFITHNGNMPSNERIAQIRVGQSKSEILNILGSPSSVVSLDRNQWIYMSSDIKRVAFFAPKEVDRDVLTIQFNDQGKVSEIERLTKKDGKEIKVSTNKTETDLASKLWDTIRVSSANISAAWDNICPSPPIPIPTDNRKPRGSGL